MRGPLHSTPRAPMGRRETIFRLAKGFRGRSKNCWSLALRRVQKGLQYAYAHRRLKKREARAVQIQQINAGAREYGISYSRLIRGLYLADIGLNRKMLSVLARQEPYSFRAIVEEARAPAAAISPTPRPLAPARRTIGRRRRRGCASASLAWNRSTPAAVRSEARTADAKPGWWCISRGMTSAQCVSCGASTEGWTACRGPALGGLWRL